MKQIFYNKTKVTTELIAFQTVYPQGDTEENQALLFDSRETAEIFFKDPLMVINTLGLKLGSYESINECIKLLYDKSKMFIGASIQLDYYPIFEIREMEIGHFIERNR